MNAFELPAELVEYLGDAGRTWKVGQEHLPYAKLYAAARVPRIECALRHGPDVVSCGGFDLICDIGAEHGSPTGMLVWFPQYSEYGIWNPTRQNASLYPGIALADIIAQPGIYLRGHGFKGRQVFPYLLEPWRHDLPDDRCTALIACAQTLRAFPETYPQALRAAMLAADPTMRLSDKLRKISDYLANQFLYGELLDALRNREDVVVICDTLLASVPLEPRLAAKLENEAARFECNAGNDRAAIARLERVLANLRYAESHGRFQKLLDHIKQLPPL